MNLLRFAIAILFLPVLGGLYAGTGEITLKEALDRAARANLDVRLADADEAVVRADLNKTRSLFLPQLSISESFVSTNDPLNVFGIKLKQEIVSQADFNPAQLNDPKSVKNYSTKFDVRQPLVNVDGWFGRASAAEAVNAMRNKKARTAHYVAFQVKMAYYKLALARQSLVVLDKALEAANANRDQARRYFEQGMIRKSDVLFAEVRTLELENRRLETVNGINEASNELSILIGEDPGRVLIPVDTLSTVLNVFPEISVDDVNQVRSDMKAFLNNISAHRQALAMNRLKFAPSLNAFGSYELNDKTPFGSRGKNWMIGAMLKWDLFSGYDQIAGIQKARAALSAAELQYKKAVRENESQLRSAYLALETARKAVALSKVSVDQADENFRILSDRYAKGLEKVSDLLMAEASLSNARLQYLQNLFAFHSRYFALELMTEVKP